MVERLLGAGYDVYPVNPKAAKRYRERKVPNGTKTDRIDAWSLADALRLDGHTWRPLKPDHPLTSELRLLCRDQITMIEFSKRPVRFKSSMRRLTSSSKIAPAGSLVPRGRRLGVILCNCAKTGPGCSWRKPKS